MSSISGTAVWILDSFTWSGLQESLTKENRVFESLGHRGYVWFFPKYDFLFYLINFFLCITVYIIISMQPSSHFSENGTWPWSDTHAGVKCVLFTEGNKEVLCVCGSIWKYLDGRKQRYAQLMNEMIWYAAFSFHQCRIVLFFSLLWHGSRIKCSMTVQTEVASTQIGYISDLGPLMKVVYIVF